MFGIRVQITNQPADDAVARGELAEELVLYTASIVTGEYIHPCVPRMMADRMREINAINCVRAS